MHWAVPILVNYVLFFALGIPESRVRRSERLKSAGAPVSADVPPVQGELVNMWLASADKVRKSLRGDPVGKSHP